MKKHAPGMDTHHGQEKDRNHWAASMSLRDLLIEEIEQRGITVLHPHNMKLKDLERILRGDSA